MEDNSASQTSRGWMVFMVLIITWTPILNPLSSYSAGVWTNEPTGAVVILDCPFSSPPSSCGVLDAYSSAILDADGTAPVSPSGVVRSTIYRGNQSGGAQLNWVSSQIHNEMFMGIIVRTNKEFEGRTTANKMFFLRGPGQNGFWGLDGPPGSPSGSIYFGHNSGSLDNSHTCAHDLGLKCFPNVNPVQLIKGNWTKVEAYVKKSTTATSRDGIVRWWVNGILSGNYTNINYGQSGLNEWVWSETWDGTVTNPTPSVDWSWYIDQLHISIPGGSNSADQPPGPPASPTLRSVTTP